MACLLSVNKRQVDGGWIRDGGNNGGLGDFVEDNSFGGARVQRTNLADVPGDGLSFPVVVGGEQDVFCRVLFHGAFHGVYTVQFVGHDGELDLKTVFYIDV